MISNPRFLAQPKDFWAHVRTVSQEVDYTVKGKGTIKVPHIHDIQSCFKRLGLTTEHIAEVDGDSTVFGRLLLEYFQWRADVLNDFVQPRLMDADKAKSVFDELCKKHKPDSCDIPWNKQKGKKKKPAYLTVIVGILIRANAPQMSCDLNPMSLTTITVGGKPLRTLARRIDGAFPSVVNPIAVGRSRNITIQRLSEAASRMAYMKPSLMEWNLRSFASTAELTSSTI